MPAMAEHWVNVRIVKESQELSRRIMQIDSSSRIRNLLLQALSFGQFGDADSVAKIIGHVDDNRGNSTATGTVLLTCRATCSRILAWDMWQNYMMFRRHWVWEMRLPVIQHLHSWCLWIINKRFVILLFSVLTSLIIPPTATFTLSMTNFFFFFFF